MSSDKSNKHKASAGLFMPRSSAIDSAEKTLDEKQRSTSMLRLALKWLLQQEEIIIGLLFVVVVVVRCIQGRGCSEMFLWKCTAAAALLTKRMIRGCFFLNGHKKGE